MYPVSQDYQEKIKENNRLFETKIQIQHSKGVLNITDKELVQGTLIYTESSQAGEEFIIGSTVASDISFTILNKPEYKDIQFIGATVICNIALLVKEGIGAHFLQPSQPSKIKGFEEKWEYVPLGRFNIDDVNIQRNTIELKAIDNMIKFDLPYSLSKLSYPATLYQIYVNACNVCDVLPGTTSFPNMHHSVKERPQDDLNFRDIIGYVSELSGTFAKCNRNGALELLWYKSTGLTLEPSNRFDFKPSDDVVQIKGIMATTEDTTYLAGSEDYAIDLTENPLLQGNYETVLRNIYNNIKDTVFTPYTSNWQGNPALMAGDLITQVDRDGKVYNTLVTKSTFKYRGKSILEARGLPEISRGYKGSTNRKVAQIKRVVEKEVGDKLTNLEQAQLNATTLMANMLGGYVVEDKENGILYIADNPDIDKATKMWKWGINGFGYSADGGVTWTTAVTADGSIVAELISAGIISADFIIGGILQSRNGSVHFDLDNNTFNLGGALIWDGNQLKLQSPDIPSESLIKNPSVTNSKDGWYNENLFEIVSQDFKGTPTSVFQSKTAESSQIISHEFKVDPAKAYQVTVWFKRNNTGGSTYLGLYAAQENGVSSPVTPVSRTGVASADTTNFYFYNTSNNSALSDWFKVTGYILPAGFNPAEAKNLGTYINCIMKPTTRTIRLRWLNYYNSGTERILWLANPQVIEISPDTIGRITEANTDITDIKNLKPGTLRGGITTVTNERVRVEHGSGQYSELRADGLVRQWPYGTSHYLTDVYLATNIRNDDWWSTRPEPVRFYLPQRFRGRRDQVEISIILKEVDTRQMVDLEVDRIFVNSQIFTPGMDAVNPYIEVRAFLLLTYYNRSGSKVTDYTGVSYDILVVGK